MDKHEARALNDRLRSDHRWAQFQKSFPGWDVRFGPLNEAAEIIYWRHKLIRLDMYLPDPVWRACHAAAHVRLHHNAPGIRTRCFTSVEESDADLLADFWTAWTGDGVIPFIDGAEVA